MIESIEHFNKIQKLLDECKNSELVSFFYQDSYFCLKFCKVEGVGDVSMPPTMTIKSDLIDNEVYCKNENLTEKLACTIQSEENVKGSADIVTIQSPFVGILEFSDTIKFGNGNVHVNKDDVLCSIEAMKIYNDIKSPVSGTVIELLVDGSNMVEYEQSIMKIRVDKDE